MKKNLLNGLFTYSIKSLLKKLCLGGGGEVCLWGDRVYTPLPPSQPLSFYALNQRSELFVEFI